MAQQNIPNNTLPLHNNTLPTLQIQQVQQGSSYFLYIAAIVVVLALVALLLLKSKKKNNRNIIALVGQRYSGKTQLFINLNQGQKLKTVPSIHNNKTSYKLGNKLYEMIDYIGDHISKQKVLQRIDQIHTIIHVIDGTNQKLISDAAMFMYRVLVNKQYQKNNCNYIIFLNKNDLSNYLGKVRIEQKLQDEIQYVKQSRINQRQQNQDQDDFIKLSKNRFKVPFKFVEGSAQSNLKQLQLAIDNL